MKIGMLGLGFMGSTHLKALKNLPQAELVAVASEDEQALTGDLSGIQGNIGGPGERMDFSAVRKYRKFQDALRDPGIEAVDICLPTNLHVEAAVAALRMGKHVLLEKPMALDGESADLILEEARKSGRILMVAQVLRFFGAYRALAEALTTGGLGTVRSALFRRRCAAPGWGRWLADPKLSGGGIFDLLIHDVDFCVQSFGKPEAVSAVGYEDLPRGIDWILAQFHYPKTGPVIVTGGWHHPKAYPFSMEYTVVSDGGTLEFSSMDRPPALYASDGKQTALAVPPEDGFQVELEYFLDCAIHGRQPEKCPPEESAAAVKLTRIMLESRTKNGENPMPHLKDLEVGLMFWAGRDPVQTLREVKELGVRCGQLGVPPDMKLESAAPLWQRALEQESFQLVTVFAAYTGESYADIPTVQRTVGFIPPATRAERLARTLALSDFAAALGVPSIACHIGFVPEDHSEADYAAVRDMVRKVCDHAARNKQSFALETGQEPAKVLLHFLKDVDRPNVGINFDPANMILYGTGDPIEALAVLGTQVLSVHCKDGDWPPKNQPGALGTERPLGKGAVGIARYVNKLKEIGYKAPLNIEREIEDREERARDIRAGVELLTRLAG